MVTTISSVAVVGTGYMGGGIAQSFALAGLPVTIADANAEATEAAYERLLAEAREFEDQGLYNPGLTTSHAVGSRLSPCQC
ncbi:3-hydroxyacyl-CoA dehydrogenase NAD-binding domain-containing protein [Promicromonospora panici]|uniref:3-hydroxyacyl-CoA dehydrogenase NAD-binding domain-containing protein n=1 Tax=Promicromonospora panici TaxID=2219658 RepID=UPI001F5D70A8|nr:3-hydroxyacyl-CoA dehydrogenase NAD-binding domain-containing protein [Promicromonospora panici]